MPLTRLVYYSENQLGNGHGAFTQLAAILQASRRNNQPLGLTGALVVDPLWFVQMLEGERRTVWDTLRRLEDDERHANVVLVEMRDCETRLFANWWMGLMKIGDGDAAPLAPYLTGGRLRPNEMSGTAMVAMMTVIAAQGLGRGTATAA